MKWFLYDRNPLHERVNKPTWLVSEVFKIRSCETKHVMTEKTVTNVSKMVHCDGMKQPTGNWEVYQKKKPDWRKPVLVSTPVLHLLLGASEWNLPRFFISLVKRQKADVHIFTWKKKKVYKDFFFLCCLFFSLTKRYLTHWTVSFHLMRTNLRWIDKFVAGLVRGIDDWFDEWNLVRLYFTLFNNTILYYIGKWKTSDLDLILACGNKTYIEILV